MSATQSKKFWRSPPGIFLGMLLLGFMVPMLAAIGFSEYQFYRAQKACTDLRELLDQTEFERFAVAHGANLLNSNYLIDAAKSGAMHLVFPALIKKHHACVVYVELGEITDKKVTTQD